MIKLGLDISTSTIGYCVLGNNVGIAEIGYIDLNKEEGVYNKVDEAMKKLDEILNRYKTMDLINIEDNMGNFSWGKTKIQTVMLLAKFNGIISYELHKRGYKTEHINVRTARKNLGFKDLKANRNTDIKERVKDFCFMIEPKLKEYMMLNTKNEIKKEFFDMVDAYVMARQ